MLSSATQCLLVLYVPGKDLNLAEVRILLYSWEEEPYLQVRDGEEQALPSVLLPGAAAQAPMTIIVSLGTTGAHQHTDLIWTVEWTVVPHI